MRNTFPLMAITVSAAALPLSGCASHLISSAQPDGTCAAGQSCSATQTSIAGRSGFSTNGAAGYITSTECGNEGLRRVEVRRNLGQGLVTLLTLGVVSPATIYFQCAKPPPPPEPRNEDEQDPDTF